LGISTALGIDFVGAFVVSLITTFIIVPWLIPRLKAKGIVGRDLNKPGKPEVAEMGGIATVIGFFAGVGALLAINGVQENNLLDINLLYASLSAVLGAAFVGIMDDLFDLRQAHKAFLPFVLALPLGATVDQSVVIPHIITLDFGVFMVIAAAFAVTCAANAANMLEGFNGLGTGLGIIMSITLVILSIQHDRMDGVYLLIPLLGALVAFLWFNKYPAIVFPGDTMMLFMGATIAAAGILSSLHVQTIFIFLPMIVEFFLKLRSDFKAQNYSSMPANGHLRYDGRIESLTHVIMKHMKVTEKSLVAIIWSLEIAMCIVVIAVDTLVY
jgi:UDP-N-acetylglucosamine--dolichyl-phosphate N-acetylglucosaminephosphotransferase